MSSIAFFDTTPTDIPHIRSVQKAVWIVTYPNTEYDITEEDIRSSFTPESDERFITAVQNALRENPNVHGWMAKDNVKIVGYCFAEKKEDKNRILSLYVLPDYQNKASGGT